MQKNKLYLLLSGVLFALFAWFLLRTYPSAPGNRAGGPAPVPQAGQSPKSSVPGPEAREEAPAPREKDAKGAEEGPKPPPQDHGRARPVKGDASPQAASVLQALKEKKNPERLSALLSPKPFDKANFEADPDCYLNSVEPGRVFQCAKPAKDVPALKAEGHTFHRLKPGDAARLSVKSAPLAPVSFTSFDMGSFSESKLNCVSVRADANGLATANFVATPGVIGDVNILAGSPMASGQVKYVVTVEDGGGSLRAPAADSQAP